MSWESMFKAGTAVATLLLLWLGFVMFTADHRIRYYYMETHIQGLIPVTCVWGYREWYPNTRVACMASPDEAERMMLILEGKLQK